MTDRELLEWAAKAAGLDWCAYYPYKTDNCTLCLQPNGQKWNPLTDDGDALRLAVKLRMDIAHFVFFVRADVTGYDDCNEKNGSDPYAATRRAIARAAAEIGKEMP